MLTSVALTLSPGVLTDPHTLPYILAFAFIGAVGAATMALVFMFRALGEIAEAYYEFRHKCAALRRRSK
jgi:hypothetical protein